MRFRQEFLRPVMKKLRGQIEAFVRISGRGCEHEKTDKGVGQSLCVALTGLSYGAVIGQQSINRAFVEGFSTTQEATFRLPLFV
jgi:hypothetical protein